MPAGQKEEIAMRQAAAMKLRVEGNTYHEIAEQLGVSVGTAYNDVKTVMTRTAAEATELAHEALDVELQRLDLATRLVISEIRAGNLSAVDRLAKINDQRAKLLGLYSPEKHEVSGGPELTPDAIAQATSRVFGELFNAGSAREQTTK